MQNVVVCLLFPALSLATDDDALVVVHVRGDPACTHASKGVHGRLIVLLRTTTATAEHFIIC